MQVRWVKIGDFRQIAGYISKTVQDRRIIIIIIIKGIYIAQVRQRWQYGYVTVYISIAISHITNCQDS